MMETLLWTLPALMLVASGWFASAWYYRRKIVALHNKVRAVRRAAAENVNQARRQIGQLQADLALRTAAPFAHRTEASAALSAAHLVDDEEEDESDASTRGHDFAPTTIEGEGFLPTMIMAVPVAGNR